MQLRGGGGGRNSCELLNFESRIVCMLKIVIIESLFVLQNLPVLVDFVTLVVDFSMGIH